ncbi:hypothetical protein PDN28_23805 [Bacillus cereus]|uniref:hypothetical protein n=1 Tax=Bacillus cereus group TaxID=86661 RepID=UPI001F56C346|nr:hypothetical protein [Bacillus cereus]MDA2268867.1 hypothetical protein [Bacillus cereus]MDC7775212.1 hypothetical protein [Bacillus cereus]
MENILKCETCGSTVHETPIIEKPLRFAYKSQIESLKQETNDHRAQENICLKEEIEHMSENHFTDYKLV